MSRGFSPYCVGRTGGKLLSGEDAELTMMIVVLGWDWAAQTDLTFKHYMPPARMTMKHARKLFYHHGLSVGIQDIYIHTLAKKRRKVGLWFYLRSLLCVVAATGRWHLALLRSIFKPKAAHRARARLGVAFFAGRWWGLFAAMPKAKAISEQLRIWAPASREQGRQITLDQATPHHSDAPEPRRFSTINAMLQTKENVGKTVRSEGAATPIPARPI